jgi:hypothetical protein
MTISTYRAATLLALALLTAGGCGAKTAGGAGGSGATGGSGGGGGGVTATGCDNPQLEILFSPMYSAYDGVHPFKIPAVVNSMDAGSVAWSASDPSMVDLLNDAALGGVMISMRKAGSVKIIAKAGGLCGVSALTISAASADDWTLGSARYNDGVVLDRVPGRRTPDGGARDYACTNCHGDTATMLQFKTVSHTPQQTGGFSDDDLLNIFTKGMVPTGGYFDTTIVSYNQWQGFHHWDMTPEQAKGMIVYLRSLIPMAQKGMRADFGGRRGDGGRNFGDGGGRRGDGGGRRGDDGAASEDAASGGGTGGTTGGDIDASTD